MTDNLNRQGFTGGEPEKHPAVAAIRNDFPSAIIEVENSCGQVWVTVLPSNSVEILLFLRNNKELEFDFLSDLTAVHWPGRRGAEFEIVYQLYSTSKHLRFRLKVRLEEGQDVETASKLWQTADWLEREVYDMFGISFEGHPDQRRILNPDGFEGHPLRKEFPLQGRVRW